MIIIKRSYQVKSPSGSGYIKRTNRKAFLDTDIDGINTFINEKSTIPGYKWINVKFNYIKL